MMAAKTVITECAAFLLLPPSAAWAETPGVIDNGDCGKGGEPGVCDKACKGDDAGSEKSCCESECNCHLFGLDEPVSVFPLDACSGVSVGG